MDEGAGIDMIDLVFLGKASNTNPVPGKAEEHIKRIFGRNFWIIWLISLFKHVLWVLIRIAWLRQF